MEESRWIIVIADHGAGARVETWDAFLEASRSLISPTIFNALRHATPPHGIRHYRLLASIWKHFERMARLPRGVLPVADALCRFNPIHGQGMSSPPSGRLLQDVWPGRAEPDAIAAFSRVHGRGCLGVRDALNMSTSADPPSDARRTAGEFRGSPTAEGALPAAIADPVVHRARWKSTATAVQSPLQELRHHAADRGGFIKAAA
jgi:hypothetical protein